MTLARKENELLNFVRRRAEVSQQLAPAVFFPKRLGSFLRMSL